jgi:hypothetical protein
MASCPVRTYAFLHWRQCRNEQLPSNGSLWGKIGSLSPSSGCPANPCHEFVLVSALFPLPLLPAGTRRIEEGHYDRP